MSVDDLLKQIIDEVRPQLEVLDPDDVSIRPAAGKWSKKEILGHLVDSAACNHRRFILAETKDDLVFEFMLNALRLVNGFSEELFSDRTGLDAAGIEHIMGPAREKGLICRDAESRWRPTALGRRFLNDLQAEFLPVQR